MAMAMDFGPHPNMMSPPRTVPVIHELSYSSLSRPQGMSNNDGIQEFCSKSNIDECLHYLDKEFQVLGLQSLYGSHGTFDLTRLVNVAHKLLRKCQQSSRYREELEARVHRSASDLEHCQSSQKKLCQTNKALQKTLSRYEESERQLHLENANLQVKLKVQHEEVKKLKSLLQSADNQHKHESKKKERQLTLIKERAQQLLTDRSKPSHVPSLEISECLMRSDGRRSKWRTESSSNRNEEDMYNAVMSNFEKRCAALQSENSRLREMLADVHLELSDIGGGNQQSPQRGVSKDQLQLPIDTIHQRLNESLKRSCTQLRDSITQQQQNRADLNSTFTTDSNQMTVAGDVGPGHSVTGLQSQKKAHEEDQIELNLSMLEEQANLSKEKSIFYKQKAKFEQEKRNFTESTHNLQKERRKLEELKRNCLTSTNGATNLQPYSPRLNGRSPEQATGNRISAHFEQIKLAVEEQSGASGPNDT